MSIKSKKPLLVRAESRTSVTDEFSALRAGELTGTMVKICSDVACFIPK